MKKHLFITFIGLCMSATSAYANGDDTLTPKQCNIENSLVYEPINEVNVTFTGNIGIAEDAKAVNPKLSATKVREIMGKTAQKIGSYPYDTTKTYGTWNERYGYGLVDAYNAVINTPRN